MAFQFKIQLKGISKPPVWRRVVVPESFTFHRFHEVIQAAFGWWDCHLYQFSPRGWVEYPVISRMEDIEEKPDMDSKKTKLSRIFQWEKQTFDYIYDFGDAWEHKITLEIITDDKTIKKASCIGGKGACPPEDCGGVWGYENFLKALADPHHPEHKETLEWRGMEEGDTWEKYAGFDLGKSNNAVQGV